jgi:hypothetical protein
MDTVETLRRVQRLGVRMKRGMEFPLEETNQKIGAAIGTVRGKVILLDMAELEAQTAGTKRASS